MELRASCLTNKHISINFIIGRNSHHSIYTEKEITVSTLSDVNKLQEKIVDVLECQQDAVPGRAGETPLGNLAAEFSRLYYYSDRFALVHALAGMVLHPDIKSIERGEKEYWLSICYLAEYLGDVDKSTLRVAFREKLFDQEMRRKRLSVWGLHGFILAGGKLTISELESLAEIKEHANVAWLGAAAMSSLFDFARENTLKLLKEDRIDLRSFLLGMDAWSKIWDSHENFKSLIEQFRDAVPSPEGKAKFTKWLERRVDVL